MLEDMYEILVEIAHKIEMSGVVLRHRAKEHDQMKCNELVGILEDYILEAFDILDNIDYYFSSDSVTCDEVDLGKIG